MDSTLGGAWRPGAWPDTRGNLLAVINVSDDDGLRKGSGYAAWSCCFGQKKSMGIRWMYRAAWFRLSGINTRGGLL